MVGSPSAAVSQDLAQLLVQAGLMRSEGGGRALHHLGRVPVPAARHPRPALVFHPPVPAGGRGAGDGPGGDSVLPVPAQLLYPGQGLLHRVHERVPAHLPAAPARVRARLPEEAQVPPVLPDALGHRAGLGDIGVSPRARRSRLCRRRDQLPHLRLHRLGAAGRSHRPLLRAALSLPQPGGGPGDKGQCPGGHRQRHHRRPDHSLPAHSGAPCHGQAEPGAAAHHHRPDPAVGAGAGDRLRFTEGVLYNQFLSPGDFALLRDHARALGVLLFENPARRLLVVTPGGHPDVRRFWKRQKHNG
ncbi:Gtf2h4 [Columba livia]|nr:Gtf2h4 [Columba livia]